MDDVRKKRGRPALSPEEKELRRVQKNRKSHEYQKAHGYPAHKKYIAKHKGEIYEPKLRIPIAKKEELSNLLSREGMTITQMFFTLVKEKYGIDLSIPK